MTATRPSTGHGVPAADDGTDNRAINDRGIDGDAPGGGRGGAVDPGRMRRAATSLGTVWRRTDNLARAAAATLLVLVVVTLVARVTGLGGDPSAIVAPRLQPPSAQWPLGTDNLGRSMLPRLLEGIGTTLLLSSLAVGLTAIVSTGLGIVAGYHGGRSAEAIMRLVDVIYSFPALILAIGVAAIVGPGQSAALAAIVLVTIPLMTRMVRMAAASVSGREFVTMARISGVATPTILRRHVLPNVAGTVAIQGSYALSIGILVEGGLSFLGYGVQLPRASLGLLIQEGYLYLTAAPWLLLVPGAVVVATIVSINIVGDSLRDHVEPRDARPLT
ncbi:MAG: ABC transporter permease [Actinomycetota bacterium]|nr:ABC transporter permease [Actinomycetota bacterium]